MHPLVQAARESALVVARTDLATLEVTGPDRSTWLQGMLTNDLAPLDQGRAVYSLALNKKGKIVADSHVVRAGDRLLLSVHSSAAHDAAAHLEHFLVMEDAELRLLEPVIRWVHVMGPSSPMVLERCSRLDGVLASGLVAGQDAAVLAVRVGVDNDVFEIARAIEGRAVCTAEVAAFDEVRAWLGVPRFPVDFHGESYPQEIGLDERAVSFNKGCYLGQEIVVKMRSRGHPSRVLVRVHCGNAEHAPAGAIVSNVAGDDIGVITSSGAAPQDGHLAFALVKWSESQPDSAVRVGGHDARLLPAWGTFSAPS